MLVFDISSQMLLQLPMNAEVNSEHLVQFDVTVIYSITLKEPTIPRVNPNSKGTVGVDSPFNTDNTDKWFMWAKAQNKVNNVNYNVIYWCAL